MNSRVKFAQKLKLFPRKLGIADVVILLYVAAFVRQWLWIVKPNSLAWVLTILLSGTIWCLHLLTKDENEEKLPRQFWLVVALPLLLIYAMRAAFPDTSFDVLDYRLINSERALRGFPFIPGDFFPSRFPFNPAPDMVTGISRHLLGYRLGTIINYLVAVWVGSLLLKLLRSYINHVWLLCLGVLLLLLTEHLLFIVNNYMVDLLALPLLLEATRIALKANEESSNRDSIRLALFLGASAAFKLTNLAFAGPILLVYAYNLFRAESSRVLVRRVLVIACAFVLPLIPFTAYIYWQTGNPVFPLYNRIFMSPFWPTNDLGGVRWGPVVDDPRWLHMKWWEVLLWPILMPFKIEHTAGNLGPHWGRLSIGFVAAIVGLAIRRIDKDIRTLSFIVLPGAVFWSTLSGMLRYATYLELIGGVIILGFAAHVYERVKTRDALSTLKRSGAMVLWVILGVQAAVAVSYMYEFEWSSRPTFFDKPGAFLNDAKYFLRDYSLAPFLPAREQRLIAPAHAWAEGSALESGYEIQLNPRAPALCLYMPEYFGTEESRNRFARALGELGDRQIFTLAYAEHFPIAIESIRKAGLSAGTITPVIVPYYSDYTRTSMALIEVLRPNATGVAKAVTITVASAPLNDDDMRAEIDWSDPPPVVLRAGLKETVYVKIKNRGNGTWPALAASEGKYRLLAGNHWLDENNVALINDDGRSILLYDLKANDEIELPLTITAPEKSGRYVLEIDMVQEAVSWFASKGSKPLRTTVTVN